MEIHHLIPYFINVLGLALYPGPTVTTVIASSAAGDGKTTFKIIVGITLANVCLIFLSGLARAAGFVLPDHLMLVLPILGSISLVLIGLKMMLSPIVRQNPTDICGVSTRGLVGGFIVHLSNPNTFIFFLSIFLSIVPLDENYIRNLVLLGTIAVVVDLLVLSNYALLSQKISSYIISNKSIMRRTPILSAVMLLFLGLEGVASGIRSVLT